MNIIDYYNTLDLKPGASKDDIKLAYKRLAIKYHPDKNSDPDAEEKFKKISEAYQYLINNSSYNTSNNSSNNARNNASNNYKNYSDFNNINSISPEELFNQFFRTNIGNHNRATNTFNFNNMNIDIDKIISNLNSRHYTASTSNNCISRESNITFQNGKRIEHIIETVNGVKSERTIITDLNSRLN